MSKDNIKIIQIDTDPAVKSLKDLHYRNAAGPLAASQRCYVQRLNAVLRIFTKWAD